MHRQQKIHEFKHLDLAAGKMKYGSMDGDLTKGNVPAHIRELAFRAYRVGFGVMRMLRNGFRQQVIVNSVEREVNQGC